MKVVHFASPSAFRQWLEASHATTPELQVGFYKKASGKGGITYKEAVDEALCFGWIDGVMRTLGAESYTLRFTPRRPGSIWSNVNVANVARLTKSKKMHPAGAKAFAARTAAKTGIYSFEQKKKTQPGKFPLAFTRLFKAEAGAWQHWQLSPPSYKHKLLHWVIDAKQEKTRLSHLHKLIARHAAGQRLD